MNHADACCKPCDCHCHTAPTYRPYPDWYPYYPYTPTIPWWQQWTVTSGDIGTLSTDKNSPKYAIYN